MMAITAQLDANFAKLLWTLHFGSLAALLPFSQPALLETGSVSSTLSWLPTLSS